MKNVIIWGSAGGIGRALAERFAVEENTVVAVSRHPGAMKAITPHVIAADVTKPAQVTGAARTAADMAGEFDLFIYAAGDIASTPIADLSTSEWARMMDSNLTGAFLTAQACLPFLTRDASLIFIGAIHERLRLPGLSTYAAAKAGLEAFAEALRKESGRRILVVRPGAVNTPFWSKVPFSMPNNALEPEALAARIEDAIEEGVDGVVDP